MAAIAVAGGVAFGSALSMVEYVRSEPVRAAAERVEHRENIPGETLRTIGATTHEGQTPLSCSDDVDRALMTVRLAMVDQVDRRIDPENWTSAEHSAAGEVRAVLACSPMDGNAWFRLALLEALQGRDGRRHLLLSSRTAPSEGWVLRNRLDFAFRAGGTSATIYRDLISSDLDTLLRWGRATDVTKLWWGATDAGRVLVEGAVDRLPEARQFELSRAGFTTQPGASGAIR